MNRKLFYIYSAIVVLAILGAIVYYSSSRSELPVHDRYVDIFDEEPSISCSNLVLTAWSNNQLSVNDDLKIALNDILHSRGLTAPVPQDQFDDIVAENDIHFKELFARAGNKFYPHCEEVFLKRFAICESENRNQSDFLKCWVESTNTEEEKELYSSLTSDNLPDLPDGATGELPPQVDDD